MTRTHNSALFALTTAMVATALSAAIAAPLAHADPLGAIRSAVNGDRSGTPCPAYQYSGALEGAAQAYARSENVLDGQPGGYDGNTVAFLGSGDPQAAAINSAYTRGAGGLISNCDYTEFGVGFVRHEDREVDVVTIVFGKPNAAKVDTVPVPVPVPATKPCEGSDPVAVGTDCPVVKPKVVTNAISATFDNSAPTTFRATVKNSSALPASCDYKAVGPLKNTTTRTFAVPPNGSATESFSGVATLGHIAKYDITIKCTDSSGTQTEPLGDVSETVGW